MGGSILVHGSLLRLKTLTSPPAEFILYVWYNAGMILASNFITTVIYVGYTRVAVMSPRGKRGLIGSAGMLLTYLGCSCHVSEMLLEGT